MKNLNDSNEISRRSPIVSASHLAEGSLPSLSEIEFALTMTNNAFHRWMVRCMAAAGQPGLSPIDVLILHSVRHRDREKTLADLGLVLNIEDIHVVSYSVKKLASLGLVRTGRRNKEKTVVTTPKGYALCERYRETRNALLVEAVQAAHFDPQDLSRVAAVLRALSGQYDQAARTATAV